MTPPSLLPLPTPGSFVSSREPRGIVYCSVSARLLESALAVVDAVLQTHDMDDARAIRCDVRYRSSRIAAKSCSTLQAFRRQRSIGEGITVNAQPALVNSSDSRLQCTLEDLLPYGDFRPLAQQVSEAEVFTTITVEKRLKNVAVTYNQLFDPSLVLGITIDVAPGTEIPRIETRARLRRVIEDHGSMVDFLRLFVSLCSSAKPPEDFTANPQHNVEIVDLATTVVDGVRVPLNAPRRAALFALAVIGTENVSVEAFARVYDSYLTGNTNAVNYWKTFAQAMRGLQKSLPFLRVVKVRPNHRTILGLNVKSAVAPNELEKWLRGRRQKVDPAQQLQNS